eukprot:g981.t1
MALQGAIGGLVAVTLTMPIETIQKNFTTNRRGKTTFFETAVNIYQESGFFGFWRGYVPLALVNVSDKFLYFFFFNVLINIAKNKKTGKVSYIANLFIGYLSDLLRLPITYPIEVISFKMITSKDVTIRRAIKDIWSSKQGIMGFYDGIYSYCGLGLRPAIQDVMFVQIKYGLLTTSGKMATGALTFFEGFWLGAISRMIATALTYPFFRAKVEFMKKKKKEKDKSIIDCIKRIYAAGGIESLWRGIYGELCRGVLFNAIMMATKESIENL